MDELVKVFGTGSITLMLGGIVGYLVRLLIDQKLRRELEDYKHTISLLGKRFDFLHQERGKTALALVRHMKTAKMHVKLLIGPMQLGHVDQEKACEDAYAACTKLHNLIADSSFLFPTALEEHMLRTRSALWDILDEARLLLRHAKRKHQSPFDNHKFGNLWKTLRSEFEPLETALIAEIRSLLGAGEGET